MQIRKIGKTGGLFRFVSIFLCIIMLLPLFTFVSFADGESAKAPYKEENLYAVVASTGTVAGNPVEYFGVRYIGTDDVERTEFVFPHGNTLKDTYKLASAVDNPEDELDEMLNKFGYMPKYSFGKEDGLRTNSLDTYFFRTYKGIKEVLGVDVFMRRNTKEGAKNEWTCNDIRVFKVDSVFGTEMSGYYSGHYFTNFSGTLLAKFIGSQWNSGDFACDKSDKVFRIGRDKNAVYDLVRDFSDGKYVKDYNASAYAKKLTFRIDIADVYGAGIESLANKYEDNKAAISKMSPIEALDVIVTYDDIYGTSRKIALPVIISSMGWATNTNPYLNEVSVIGIAQQGDTLIFEGIIPDFKTLTGYSIYYGKDAAKTADIKSELNERAQERLNELENDDMYYAGISVFDSAKAGAYATNEDAVLLQTTQGNPMYYFKSATSEGQKISNNQQKSIFPEFKIPPETEAGAVTLISTDSGKQRYIFEITTDLPDSASTTDEISVLIKYLATDGNMKSTELLPLRDVVRDFYGYWPAKDNKDIAYLNGTTTGGKLVFALDNNDVDYFTEMQLSIESDKVVDDWQMSGIRVYKVNSVSKRKAEWLEYDRVTPAFTTDRIITREYDTSHPWQYYEGSLLLTQAEPKKSILFSETGGQSVVVYEPDWPAMKKSMTYSETLQDFGFDQARYSYTVEVEVQSNSVADDEMGDCGSVNKFYFQLIFEDGTSGYVQANQQLTGDGFRAGHTETFTIDTNRNYGDLKAIRIIPDDTVDEDNIYDKLNINTINVIQNSTSGLSSAWNFAPVGWIGIDYQDSGAQSTAGGQKLRSEFELSRNYLVGSKGYSMNLLFALTTGEYEGQNPVLQGNVSAVITYRNSSGIIVPINVDVAKAIGEYAERGTEVAPSENPGIAGKRLLDTSYMLRENHIDRFIVSLTNVKEVLSIKFLVGGTVNTTWNLTDVSVYIIEKDGPLVINSCNEYQREAEITCICSSISTSGYKMMSAYDSFTNTTTVEEYEVIFSDYTIEINPETWATEIEKVPSGDDDACNIYLYPIAGTELDKLNKVSIALKYQSREYDKPYQVSLNGMHVSNEFGTVFYRGLSTKAMTKLNELAVKSDRDVYFSHAIVQQIRSNVVVRTYFIPFDPTLNASITSVSAVPYKKSTNEEKQIVSLQFTEDTAETELVENLTDVAVGFTYNTENDVSNVTFNSAFVYLTDQDIMRIKAGQRIDVEFSEYCVKDITNITVAATNTTVNATVQSAIVSTFKANSAGTLELKNQYTFSDKVAVTRNKLSVAADDAKKRSVADLLLTVNFDESAMTSQMLNDKISVKVGYTDYMGDTAEFTVNDLEKYLISSESSRKKSITANILVPNVLDIRYVFIEPHSSDAKFSAGIPVTTIDAEWTIRGEKTSVPTRTVNSMIEEGDGYSVNLADVSAVVDLSVMKENGDVLYSRSIKSRSFDVAVTSPEYIYFVPEIVNSDKGYDIKVESISGAKLYDLAKMDKGYSFKVNSDEDSVFRITVLSKEMPNIKAVLNITVKK